MRVDRTQRPNPSAPPMRIQIVYTVEVPDEYRRAINAHFGRAGLASRAEVREWYMRFGASLDQDLTAASVDVDAWAGKITPQGH